MWLNIKSFDQYHENFEASEKERLEFWDHEAGTFYWRKRWDSVQTGDFENADIRWFVGGKLNITENALDRHLNTIGNKTAFIFLSIGTIYFYIFI